MVTERWEWIWQEYRQDFVIVQGEEDGVARIIPRFLAGLVVTGSLLRDGTEVERSVRWRGENKEFSFVLVEFSVSDSQTENLIGNWVYGSGTLRLQIH